MDVVSIYLSLDYIDVVLSLFLYLGAVLILVSIGKSNHLPSSGASLTTYVARFLVASVALPIRKACKESFQQKTRERKKVDE